MHQDLSIDAHDIEKSYIISFNCTDLLFGQFVLSKQTIYIRVKALARLVISIKPVE